MVLLVVVSVIVTLALLAERLGRGVEGLQAAADVARACAQRLPFAHQGGRVGGLHRTKTAVAAAPVGGTNRATAGMRHRPEAGRALHRHADRAASFAFDTDAV